MRPFESHIEKASQPARSDTTVLFAMFQNLPQHNGMKHVLTIQRNPWNVKGKGTGDNDDTEIILSPPAPSMEKLKTWKRIERLL